jgi:hypothetical protein
MCKEMPVIPVDRVVDKKSIIGNNGGPRRRRRSPIGENSPNLVALIATIFCDKETNFPIHRML